MKSTFISREHNDVKFTLEFSAEEFEKAVIKAYQANKGKFSVDGFRKGKAPRTLIERHYGEDVFFEDAINDLFSQNYFNALDELNINVVDRPNADFSEIKKGEGFTVTITVTAYPEFEVKDYKGVEIAKVENAVTDEDVDKELEALQKRNARMVLAERAAKEGDTVLIDYAGFVGEEQFEGGTAERQPLKLGSNTFIPGFEEQLIGCSAGEEKDVKVTFPEEYHSEDLSGKEAVFKCKIHEVKEEELPELNDEFAKDVSEFDTLEELKKDKKEKLEKSAQERAVNEMKNAVLEKIYEANDIEIPQVMIEDEIDGMIQEFDQQLRYQGMSLDQYFQYLGKEPKDFREELREDATKKTKTRMLISAIADAEKLEAPQEDIDKEFELMAAQYKMEVEQIKSMLGSDNFALLEKDIKMRKAVDFAYDNAVIK
ncbi:trigger factor [Aminipila luticellarii]|uniref:Trigger factor n=1 Tax=Aminipila luticellarii TaxID=2507160 RepID=A0A410PTA0_9FIRM|nr:trigger factor [Aminipila luticellarii]QAT42116.1 trigger factor [Aminipila luticellarii]